MINNKQTYDWTKSGSFIKMIRNNQKQTLNRLLKGPIARAPKSSRSGYYPDREEAEPIDLTRRYTTEENNAISSYWKKRQEEEKKQEFEQKLNQLKQLNDADKQLDEDYKNSLFGKLDIIAQSPLGNVGLYNNGLKNAFLVKEAIGSFLDNSTLVHGQNITGRILDEDLAVLEAEAHKYLAEQKLQLLRLIDQRNLHEETNGRDDTYYQFQKQIANLIEKQKNLDPIIQQLDDAYKERYVNEHSNFLERTRKFLGSATAYGEEGRALYKANVRKQYEAKAKLAYEKETISSFMDTVDSNLLLSHALKSADPNMRLLWERANNSLKSGDTNSYNGYVNQIKAKINASPISQKLLYAESNPDYFLDGTTYTPEEKRNLKGLRNDREKLLDYKIILAKERVLNNNYRQKTASEEYDGSLMDYESQIRLTDEVINHANANKKELAEDYKNTMDWQDTFKKYVGVGKGYKLLEQLHQDDWIINPNYWIYCMPGTIGSSNSSPEGLIGQGIQYGSLIGGPVGAALGSLVSTPFQTKSGFDENYAETAERYLSKSLESINGFDITLKGSDTLFKDLQNKAIDAYRKQGMSEEWIAEHCDITNDQGKKNLLADLYNGIISSNDTRLKKVQLDAMRGLTAMREADNMRTMGSMPIEIAAQMIPADRLLRHFGTIRRAAKDSRILSNLFLNRVVDNEGRLVATTAGKRASSEITENAIATGERYANGFRKPKSSMIDTALSGGEQGAVLGTLTGTGVVGNAVFGAAGAAARATGKLAYKMLPANQKAFIEATARAVNGKFMGVYDKLLPMGSFRRSMVKYGLPAIQRLTVNSISEATEEGVQYLNSKKDFSKYGFGGMSLGDLIINDWSQGAEVARSYAALLGIGDSELMNDAEYWNNVKGGFALGGGHAGIIQIANATRDAYRQYKTDNFIIDSSVMNRQADQIARANDKAFALLVMKGRGDYALETLNDMEAKDRRNDNPQYTQEDYDYKRQQLRTIIAATNNNNIRNVLKAHGIEYGTEKYAAAIADIANTHRGVQENILQSVELSKAIDDFYSGEDYNKAVNEAMNTLAANDSFSLAHSVEIMKRALLYSDENLGERKEGETSEQYEERRAQLYNEGKKKAEDEFKAGILARSKDVNRLKALLHLRAQLNTIEDWFKIARDKFNIHTKRPDAAIIRKNINKQIDSLKNRLFKLFAQDFEGIDINKVTDADLLTHLDGMDGVAKVDNLDEIIQLHKAEAMLSADADVLKLHDLRFTKGIVRNKNGEYEYNPAKYQYERDLDKQRREAKRSGIKFTEKPFEESRYGNKVDLKDPYAERIDRILQVDYENEQLNWMIEDLYNGDLVNLLIEDDTDDYSEQEVHYGDSDLIDIKQPETPQKTTLDAPLKPSNEPNKAEWRERKRKERKRRKEAARRRWEKRRKLFNRKQRGRMNIDFTLGTFKIIGDIGFRLMKSAAVASYTFQEFVEDMKEALGDDYSAKNMLAALKQYYIRASVKYPEENVSSTDEVIAYDNLIDVEPKSSSTTTLSLKDMLAEANKKIIPEISSFWHTFVNENGVITMYSNLAWSLIRDLFGTEKYLNRVAAIKKATETQESFDKYLKENDLEKYSKYRNVNGIEEAIAKEFEIQDPELNWAIDIRHSIIQYLTTGQLPYIFDVPQEQIEEYLNKLSEIKKFIDDNNLDLIDTSLMLYGTDKEGNNITCQADVLMVDSEGKVYMWDVVQSYLKVTDNLNNLGKRSPVTNRERNYLDNKSVYDILTNKFGVNIKQIRLLPVQLDLKNHHLHMEKSISVDPGILNSTSYHDFNADDINKSREKLIILVNEAVRRYNEYAERLKSDTRFNEEEYSSIDSAVEADADYRRLQEKLEDVLTEYDVLNDKLGDITSEEYQEALKSSYNYFEYSNDEQYGLDLVNTLSNVCEDLDIALSQFSFVGNITEDEAKQLDYICNKIFDAQRIIDDILHQDIAKTIDISKEQQLVASAMESLYRVYGKSNMNVKYKVGAFSKWWLSDVRKLSSGESTLLYISNKLDNINSAFMLRDPNGRIHLIDDLQNDELLQRWYNTLLNTYYQEFLNSAQNDILEKYDPNNPLVAQVLEKISIGNEFILMFNELSITQRDETLNVDDINAINVEHQDLYNTTTAVHPSRNFAWKAGPKWSSISNYPDLIEKGKFEFIMDKNGKLFLNVKYADRGGRTFEINLPFEETEIKDADLYNESIKPFINKVKNMLEYKQTHPNAEIKFEVFRNRGSVNYTNQHHNVLDFLLKGFNRKKDGSVYTIDDLYAFCMNQTTRFGVLKITQPIGQGQKYQFGIYTGNNLSMEMGLFDDRYDKQNLQLSSGTIIFNYDTNKPDKNGVSRYLKVALGTQQFGPKMAEKIARVLMDVATGNRNDNFSQEALMDMLKMILYIPQGSNKTLSVFNSLRNSIIIDKNKIVIGDPKKDGTTYTPDMMQELVQRLSEMHFLVQGDTINQFFSTWNCHLMNELKTKFKTNPNLQKIELPIGITIERADFEHKNYGVAPGTTLFGYLLRNTIIYTDAQSLSNCELNVDNVVLVDKNATIQKQMIDSVKQEEENVANRTKSEQQLMEDLLGGLMMTDEQGTEVLRTEEDFIPFKAKVEAYFLKVLGKNGAVKFGSEEEIFLGQLHDKNVLAACGTQLILMSKYAPEDAMFHEAFHKILELIVPNELRESFYEAYRKEYGYDLSERDVAEGLCDEFVNYINNRNNYRNKGNVWKKIGNYLKFLIKCFGIVNRYGLINGTRMISVFNKTDKGKYTNAEIKQDKIKRYKEKFGDFLYYQVKNRETGETAEFENIKNSTDLRETANALATLILVDAGVLRSKVDLDKIIIDNDTPSRLLSNPTIKQIIQMKMDSSDEFVSGVFNEIFESRNADKVTKGKLNIFIDKGKKNKLREIDIERVHAFDKFNILKPYIAESILSIITAYDGKFKEYKEALNDEPVTDETRAMLSNIDKFDRSAFEFSKLDSVSKQVKLFFSTILYHTENPRYTGENSLKKFIPDVTRNRFFLPQLMPINEVFNIIVNDLGDVDSVLELYDRLKQKADYNPMYWKVFNKFDEIYSNQYIRDENDHIVGINYDNEAFVTQIFNSIKSQRIGFYIVKSDTDSEGNKSTRLIRSQFIQDALVIPSNWNLNMLNGVVNIFDSIKDEEGKYRFKEGGKDNLSHIISVLQDIRNNIGKLGDTEFEIDGETYRLDKVEDVIRIKEKTILMLNALGIMISKEMLNYKLFTQYQGNDQHALNLWLKSQGTDSFNAFLNILSNFIKPDGTINQNAVEIGYKNSGFVKDLGNWQGKYNSVTTQSMSLAFDGKKVYNISQNHTISHITNQLNKSVGVEEKTQYVKTLMNFSYNQNAGEGSILLKAILNSATVQFKLGTYIGFKTDTPGDVGSEFKSEPEIEDYMAKLTMLQLGCMIFPTLADKGTWTFLELLGDSNVRIPGMTYGKVPVYNDKNEEIGEKNTVFYRPNVRKYFDKNGNKKYYLKPNNSVLDQFLEYARCECLAIQQCMEDLGYEEIHGYTKTERTVLKEEQKIKNYHTGKLPNGTRFLSLTKLLVPTMKGDQKKLILINLNDPNKSSNEMLKLAYKHLFDKSIDEQREIIAATLHIQNELAMKKAVLLGLIEKKNGHYYNKHLNQTLVNTLYTEFYKGFEDAFKANGIAKYSIDEDLCRDLAILALLGDVTNRSIISSEECERCFSGHPGMFKVKYDYKKGVIKDSTSDKQKRIGGMVSTGDDNRRDMPGIPETYVCAECEDYEVQSTAKIYSRIKGLFHDSQLREAYGNYMQQAIITEHKQDGYNEHGLSELDREEYDKNLSEVWDDAYNLSIDEIKSKLPKEIVDKAERLAAAFASAYDEGINVADGAAYITEDMCANLLRKRGAFTQDVKEAFEILKDKSNPWVEQYEAYKKIFEATTLVTTKYTAYGMRPQNWIDENGNYQLTDIAVPYYNKFALFPLFDCIATGKMRGIYDKMRNEGVDMLLMTSAIKIGSQGPVSFNGEQIEGTFNKYEQSYDFLRRQLNTDPEEEHAIAMGTQMVKIALSNLRLYRNNYKVGDKTMTGEQIRDEFMKHIIELSKIGVDKFRLRFYNKEGKLDPIKIAEYLKKLLTDRNANRSIIEAIELIDNPGVPGSKKQASPLAATTSAAWIESIMISAANKDIVDIITPGNSFVQRSVFAIEGEDGEGKIEGKEYYNGKKLEMINNKNSMDAVISIDYFEDILPEGLSFKEQRDFLIKHNIVGENAESNTIGYRIPTQAQSSIHALRFLDVVPAVKSTIILPQEFTKITGSDFDIDHLYLASQNIKLVKKKGEDTYDLIKDFEEGTEKYHLNMMLSYMIALLQDVDNSMNSLYKSIDNDTELPKRIADTIQSAETNQDTPYNFGALHELVTRRNDYITGKTGIGPFALNVTSNVLTYLFGVSFNPEREICKYTLIGRLDMSVDVDGNSIAAWISAFINAHVDIVKDPWVSKLNVNPYTYNLINLLVRSGYGEGALWFCIQPVIKAMAEASNNFSSKYTKSRKNKKSRNDVILEAASNITGNKYTEADIKKELRRKVDWLDERGDYHKMSYGTYCVIKVFDDIKNGNPIDQNEVLYAFFAIKPYSDALSNLVKYTKIDTRKQGKTFIEIQRYLDQYRRMFHEETSYGRILEMDKPIWDMDSLDRLINGSWIEFKTENGINEPLNVLLNQTFNGNKTFINNAIKYADKLIANDEEENTPRFLKSLSQAMITQIKSIFVNEYAKDNNINIKELFIGPKSIAVQLDRLKYLILTDERFKHLQNNALINALVSTPARYDMKVGFKPVESPRFIKTIRKLDGGAIDENPLIDAWEDLLNDPRMLKFSRKLVVYAFVTSGESGKMGTLLKYLPPSFVRGELLNSTTDRGSFSDYISNVLASPHEIEDALNLDLIVLNNYTNYNFVSKTTLTYTDEKGREFNRFNFIKNEQDPLSPLVLIDTSNEVTAPYITVNKQGKRKFTNPAVDLNLYKKVEPGVYILMPKRGYSDRDGNIYEYSDDYGFDFNQNVGYTYENYQNAFRYLSQFIRNVRKNNKTIDNYSIFYNTILNRLLNNAVEANADADFEYMQNRLAEIKKEKELSGEQQTTQQKSAETKQEIISVLGGDKIAETEFNDAVGIALKGKTFEESIATVKSIFTKQEQEQIKEALSGNSLFVKSVSRLTDPAFYSEKVIEFLQENSKKPFTDPSRINVIELWTKHDGEPIQNILEACKKYKVAPIVSFSITGMGNTAMEPGVMKYQDLLSRIERLIKNGYLNPITTTVRIDPILIGETSLDAIKDIVNTCKNMGIKKFVTSLVQSYGYTDGTAGDRHVVSGINAALLEDGRVYDWDTYYGRITQEDVNTWNKFFNEYRNKHPEISSNLIWSYAVVEGIKLGIRHAGPSSIGKIFHTPKKEFVDQIGQFLTDLNKDSEINIETCSFHVPGMKESACLDPLVIERITGIDVMSEDGTYKVDTSRPECMCYGVHGDLFRKGDRCYSSCAYCYAAHSSDNKLTYYNPDGSIKDNRYTRIGGVQLGNNEPRVVQPNSKETKPEQQTISNTENNPNAYSMTSGGAYGADTAWDIYARKFGITNIFHYRDSKNVKLSSNLEKQGVKAFSLTEEQMEYARQEMSKLIGRPLNDNVQDNLQARNYYLVTNADAIFAIATISGNSVKGGTNNAITAAKSMLKPIHVWDINTEKWYKYDYNTNSFVAEETPTLTERFAGIGSRDIQNYQILKDGKWVYREQYVGDNKKKAALNAIREVFENTFGKLVAQQPTTITETSQQLAPATPTALQQKQQKTSVTYTPKGKTKQTYEVKEDSTGIHIFNKDGKEVFIKKGTADRNKIIANYKWLNGDAVVVEHGGHEYIVMRSGDKRVVIQRITGKTKKFGENDIERQEIIDKANKKFSEKDAANNMQSTISELDKLGEQRKKDCE